MGLSLVRFLFALSISFLDMYPTLALRKDSGLLFVRNSTAAKGSSSDSTPLSVSAFQDFRRKQRPVSVRGITFGKVEGRTRSLSIGKVAGSDNALAPLPKHTEPDGNTHTVETFLDSEEHFDMALSTCSVTIECYDSRATWLLDATRHCNAEVLQKCLQQAPRDKEFASQKELGTGMTALHIAAEKGDATKIEALIRFGADVNAQDQHGYTPLALAVEYAPIEAVNMLLECGADSALPDRRGMTPFHRIQHSSHQRFGNSAGKFRVAYNRWAAIQAALRTALDGKEGPKDVVACGDVPDLPCG